MSKQKITKKITAPRGGYRRTIESGRNREFVEVEVSSVGRNPFDLSHNFAFTGNLGELIPTLCKVVYPNEDWTIGADMLVRLQALVAPAMHRLDVRTDFFAVPLRLLWPNFEKFVRNDASGAGLPAWPFVTVSDAVGPNIARFLDYIGVNVDTGVSGTAENISAMAGAAYNMIYNEWYRAGQVITTPLLDQLSDGNNNTNLAALFGIQKVSFEHDYFTSCLPDPQLGASPVDIPLGLITTTAFTTQQPHFVETTGVIPTGGTQQILQGPPGNIFHDTVASGQKLMYDPDGTLQVEATTITDLRRAEIMQEWLERTARGGDRYTEVVLMHFNEHTSDARLQRPEFISGVTSPVHISEVLNTTGEDGGLPQGNMAGHGVSVAEGTFGHYHSEEHCIIMGLTYIIPKPAYFQGIPREFDVPANPLDGLMWPTFAHIGEQAVRLRELYAFTPDSNEVFGFNPRFSELKYAQNRIAGLFKTPAGSGGLSFWTFARRYGVKPTLSKEFLEVDATDFLDPFAVEEDDLILFNVYFKIRAIRCLPTFSTPHL